MELGQGSALTTRQRAVGPLETQYIQPFLVKQALRQADDPADVRGFWTISKGLWNAYFWVSDADALHAAFVRNGAKIDYPVCDQPYGCREFGVQDLDGYDIGFGQQMAA